MPSPTVLHRSPRAPEQGSACPNPSEADRLARRVLTTRVQLKPKENVTIETFPSSLPWAAGFVREARRMGARPLVLYEDEDSYWAAVDEGREDLIGNPGTHEWATLEKTDVYVFFWGPEDRARVRELSDAQFGKLIAFNRRWYRTASRAGLRGVRMGIARVTESNARHWGVPVDAWRREMVNASMQDPEQFVAGSRKLTRAFRTGKEVRVQHPNGTDLRLRLAGRPVYVALGRITAAGRRELGCSMASVPDGSVYVSVDERTADGTLVSNRMSALFDEPVRGGIWTFRKGRLVEQNYDDGAAIVRGPYAKGGPGRDRPSMLEVGLDPNIRVSPKLEENECGAVSIGVGSNVGFGGKTRCHFLAHLTIAGAELSIDGRLVARAGRVL